MSIELYVPFLAHQLGCTPEEVEPSKGSAMELAELLYPFAQRFSGDGEKAIRELTYSVQYELAADAFLEELEADPFNDNGIKSAGAAHVLYERARQAIVVCGANAAARQLMLVPPKDLSEGIRQVAAALLMLHRMTLPFHPRTVIPAMPE